MKNIKIILCIMNIFCFTTIFSSEGFSDEAEESFYEIESAWEQDLDSISEKDNWDVNANRPTVKWIDEAVESAFDKMADNKELNVDVLSKNINDKLTAIYVKQNPVTGKKYMEQKDLNKIANTINEFEKKLKNKINSEITKPEIKRSMTQEANQQVIIPVIHQNFQNLLSNISVDWWGNLDEIWKNKIIAQAIDFIQSNGDKNSVINQITVAIDKYKTNMWTPFYKYKLDEEKDKIIKDIDDKLAYKERFLEQKQLELEQKQLEQEQEKKLLLQEQLRQKEEEELKRKEQEYKEQQAIERLQEQKKEVHEELKEKVIKKNVENFKREVHQDLKKQYEKKKEKKLKLIEEQVKKESEERSKQFEEKLKKMEEEEKEWDEKYQQANKEFQALKKAQEDRLNREKLLEDSKQRMRRVLQYRKKMREAQEKRQSKALQDNAGLQQQLEQLRLQQQKQYELPAFKALE